MKFKVGDSVICIEGNDWGLDVEQLYNVVAISDCGKVIIERRQCTQDIFKLAEPDRRIYGDKPNWY